MSEFITPGTGGNQYVPYTERKHKAWKRFINA